MACIYLKFLPLNNLKQGMDFIPSVQYRYVVQECDAKNDAI
jgi:hypothetical protein